MKNEPIFTAQRNTSFIYIFFSELGLLTGSIGIFNVLNDTVKKNKNSVLYQYRFIIFSFMIGSIILSSLTSWVYVQTTSIFIAFTGFYFSEFKFFRLLCLCGCALFPIPACSNIGLLSQYNSLYFFEDLRFQFAFILTGTLVLGFFIQRINTFSRIISLSLLWLSTIFTTISCLNSSSISFVQKSVKISVNISMILSSCIIPRCINGIRAVIAKTNIFGLLLVPFLMLSVSHVPFFILYLGLNLLSLFLLPRSNRLSKSPICGIFIFFPLLVLTLSYLSTESKNFWGYCFGIPLSFFLYLNSQNSFSTKNSIQSGIFALNVWILALS